MLLLIIIIINGMEPTLTCTDYITVLWLVLTFDMNFKLIVS